MSLGICLSFPALPCRWPHPEGMWALEKVSVLLWVAVCGAVDSRMSVRKLRVAHTASWRRHCSPWGESSQRLCLEGAWDPHRLSSCADRCPFPARTNGEGLDVAGVNLSVTSPDPLRKKKLRRGVSAQDRGTRRSSWRRRRARHLWGPWKTGVPWKQVHRD